MTSSAAEATFCFILDVGQEHYFCYPNIVEWVCHNIKPSYDKYLFSIFGEEESGLPKHKGSFVGFYTQIHFIQDPMYITIIIKLKYELDNNVFIIII